MLGILTAEYKGWKQEWEKYKNTPGNISVVNLGSSMSYYDFDYTYWCDKWIGFNMASAPQTIAYDYKVLKQYSDYLGKDCVVIISLAEFSLLVDKYPGDYHNLKYYGYLNPEAIDGYSQGKARLLKAAPGILYPQMISNAFKDVIKKLIRYNGESSMTIDQMSDNLFNGWRAEFGWENEFVLSVTQRETLNKTRNTLYSMLEYIKEHGWNTVVAVPPFPGYLTNKMPDSILKECLWDELDRLRDQGIQVLDFTKDKEITKNEYYKTAVALNENGKKLFNQSVESQVNNKRKICC